MIPSLHALRWRWRARRFRQAPRLPAIFLYHSVARRDRDPLHLSLAPEKFAAQLDWLAAATTPLPLAEFVRRHRAGTLPADATAVTFDDGYADNIHLAEPLLRRHQIPATVFVTTDYVNTDQAGWWDELAGIFLDTPILPPEFTHLGFHCTVEAQPDATRARWTVLAPPQTRREHAFLAASTWARGLAQPARAAWLAALRQWSGRRVPVPPESRFASWADLRAARQRGLLSVGAHTCSHPSLARLPPAEQLREIIVSCAVVREQLSEPPAGFAYPFGDYHDFSPVTCALARYSDAGFACANLAATVSPRADDWQLPRVLVGDWTADELDRWFRP